MVGSLPLSVTKESGCTNLINLRYVVFEEAPFFVLTIVDSSMIFLANRELLNSFGVAAHNNNQTRIYSTQTLAHLIGILSSVVYNLTGRISAVVFCNVELVFCKVGVFDRFVEFALGVFAPVLSRLTRNELECLAPGLGELDLGDGDAFGDLEDDVDFGEYDDALDGDLVAVAEAAAAAFFTLFLSFACAHIGVFDHVPPDCILGLVVAELGLLDGADDAGDDCEDFDESGLSKGGGGFGELGDLGERAELAKIGSFVSKELSPEARPDRLAFVDCIYPGIFFGGFCGCGGGGEIISSVLVSIGGGDGVGGGLASALSSGIFIDLFCFNCLFFHSSLASESVLDIRVRPLNISFSSISF